MVCSKILDGSNADAFIPNRTLSVTAAESAAFISGMVRHISRWGPKGCLLAFGFTRMWGRPLRLVTQPSSIFDRAVRLRNFIIECTMSTSHFEHNDLEDFEADAEDHIITINLNSAKANQPVPAAKRVTTTNFQDAATYRQNELSIAASMIYTDGDGAHRFRIITRPSGPSTGRDTVKDDHWL